LHLAGGHSAEPDELARIRVTYGIVPS
jgi:hypothetical protein